MARVKAGDLAYLVRASNPANIGRVVEVLYQIDFILSEIPGTHWKIRSAAPMMGTRSFSGSIVYAMEFDCPESWLVPIAGPSIADMIDEEIDITDLLPTEV